MNRGGLAGVSLLVLERSTSIYLALAVAALTAQARAEPAAQPSVAASSAGAPTCGPSLAPAVHFAPGELFRYRLDLLGADIGTFEISVEAPPAAERNRARLLVKSKARTSAFISTNVGRYEAFAQTLLGADLHPISYREETDEGETHRSQDVHFPPSGAKLDVRATRNGMPEPVDLDATASARDMLSAFFVLRGTRLAMGAPFCSEIYAGRKMWRVSGAVGGREQVETPLGRFSSVRIDTRAVRTDDPSVVRTGHFWISEDGRRLPIIAIAEVKGKTVRAQLAEVSGPFAAPVKAARPTRPEETRANSGGSSIGRR